jgi:GT2 family glycosyltransferase
MRILVVIVLYKMPLAESPTYRALRGALRERPELAAGLELLVADNSPEAQLPGVDFAGRYAHDGTNPGLARRYNEALGIARATGCEWLLLFDQDTRPTTEYFEELERFLLSEPDPEIAVAVPKLVMDGRILSPHAPVFRKAAYEVTLASAGVVGQDLRAFNSASLVRASALDAIGGFPEEYWLDYLDHATFHRIQAAGGRIHVLQARLEHELSDAVPDRPVNPVRLLNRLRAEARFYREFGSLRERMLHRLDLLRQVVGWGRRGHFEQAHLRWKALRG